MGAEFIAGVAVGLVICIALSRVLRLRVLVAGTLVLAATASFLFATFYEDEFCEEDAGCTVLAEPAYLVLSRLVPGLLLGVVILLLWRLLRMAMPASNRDTAQS